MQPTEWPHGKTDHKEQCPHAMAEMARDLQFQPLLGVWLMRGALFFQCWSRLRWRRQHFSVVQLSRREKESGWVRVRVASLQKTPRINEWHFWPPLYQTLWNRAGIKCTSVTKSDFSSVQKRLKWYALEFYSYRVPSQSGTSVHFWI